MRSQARDSQARDRSFETLGFRDAGIRICEGLKYCNSLLQASMFDKEAWIRLTLLAGLGTYLDLTLVFRSPFLRL